MTDTMYHPSAPEHRAGNSNLRISWVGSPWSLVGICFLNALPLILGISILALFRNTAMGKWFGAAVLFGASIYWFWARTEYRRYMWRMVRINDEPLEYTGKGSELLIGFLMVFFFVLLPFTLLFFGIGFASNMGYKAISSIVSIPLLAMYVFLPFAAVFRAHRYLLSRTRWRGIPFGLEGHAIGYAWEAIWTSYVNACTLGWLLPWRTTALRRRLINAVTFGSVPFEFKGRSNSLYGPFAVLWIGVVFITSSSNLFFLATEMQNLKELQGLSQPFYQNEQFIPFLKLGIGSLVGLGIIFPLLSSWYEARKLNMFAEALRVENLKGKLNANTGELIWLTISNFFILVLSLGILRPVTQARRLNYIVRLLSFDGEVDLSGIVRGAEAKGLQSAGLEVAFSIDVF